MLFCESFPDATDLRVLIGKSVVQNNWGHLQKQFLCPPRPGEQEMLSLDRCGTPGKSYQAFPRYKLQAKESFSGHKDTSTDDASKLPPATKKSSATPNFHFIQLSSANYNLYYYFVKT